VVNWDIFEGGRRVASFTASHFDNDGRIIRYLNYILVITHSNSSFISSTLTIIPPLNYQDYSIRCNDAMATNIPRSSIMGRS